MKKLYLIFWILLLQTTYTMADSVMACSNAKISSNSASCDVCFDGGSLYYRSDRTVESISDFSDTFYVNAGTRVMWQDETTVNWNQINQNFTLGSSISQNRADANGFKFQFIPGSWQTAQNAPNTGRIYGLFPAGSSVKYVQTTGGVSLNNVLPSATPADRNKALWRVTYNAASHEHISAGNQGPKVDHIQCSFIFPKWCGDNFPDTDKGEQCDDGNMDSGDGCSNTCQHEPLTCDNLNLSAATLSQTGGTITATCAGTNESQYKFILREGSTVIQTVDYQTNPVKSFTVNANAGTGTKTYAVECLVKNLRETDKTANACKKEFTVPGVTNNPSPVCTNLSINPTSLGSNGGSVTASCTGTNVTEYKLSMNNSAASYTSSANQTFTVPGTPGTYTFKCLVKNAQATDITTSACEKSITVPPVQTAPTCDNLSLSNPSGRNINYSCTGSGTITSYSITQNGSVIATNASGSLTVPYGTHVFTCTVNNTITSTSCQRSITITEDRPNPRIEVRKDDNDNRDDQQQIQSNGMAQFSIRVTNTGPESLDSVTLDDPRSPSCNRSSSDTYNLIRNIGNRDTRLDPGESFTYTCQQYSVNTNTFPNNENRICVNGIGVTSGTNTNDCDTTRIYFGGATCERMDVDYRNIGDKSRIQATCGPTGLYRLAVTRGGQIVTRQQSNDGRFSFDLSRGNYSIGCLRDGETSVKPQCQKNISIQDQPTSCTMRSSVRYGGTPLRTQLRCETPNNNACIMEIYRNGKLGKTLHTCQSNMTLSQKGNYDIICKPQGTNDSCETTVQVDVPTDTPTGSGAWLMLIIALLGGGGILYLIRRKQA